MDIFYAGYDNCSKDVNSFHFKLFCRTFCMLSAVRAELWQLSSNTHSQYIDSVAAVYMYLWL